MPKQILPIKSFILGRLSELGLTEDEFLHRLGFRKMETGRQHLERLYLGDRAQRCSFKDYPRHLNYQRLWSGIS